MNILAIGDIVGRPGIEVLKKHLRALKKLKNISFVVANGENANGLGITKGQAEEIFSTGVDVITLGNHAFHVRESATYFDDCPYILRPYNLAPQTPGRGMGIYDAGAVKIKVINLIGRCMMDFGPDNPFHAVDKLIKDEKNQITIVDFHAQATSEKLAMGFYLDGRVSAVFGTHTHVQTADERVNPKGTGYISDIGMTGPVQSVLGVKPEQSIAFFRGDIPSRFETASGDAMICGAVFEIDKLSGSCLSVERILMK
ncbi:MAG: TIGR00282 family metallophosphoesterase [Clostridiales bacterium]|nr:TIGR00282 family metallophosphoesterase [Clostridiales bacterium]